MSLASRVGRAWLAATTCAACTAGCAKSPTPPSPSPPAPTRQVSATVVDGVGARIPALFVFASRLDAIEIELQQTDTAGVARFTLPDGRWCFYTTATPVSGPLLVAGSTGQVAHRPAGILDSVLFRLVLQPESVARGKVTLQGQAAHPGTIVGASELPAFVTTAADGSYELGGLPPGAWTGLATHEGYQAKLFDIPVPAPGNTIDVSTISLVPGGPVAKR